MGFIYKITNNLNNLIYVGQTTKSLNNRYWIHVNDSKRLDRYKGSKLYNAMRKYGFNHFKIELIEETENTQLDEREKYWINYYNSKNNGYNMTLSGQGIPKRRTMKANDKETLQEIKKDYYNNMTTQELAEKYNISGPTVWRRLKSLGIHPNVGLKKLFIMKKNNEEYYFQDTASCADFILTLNISNGKRKTIMSEVRNVLQNKKQNYLGYNFIYESEIK